MGSKVLADRLITVRPATKVIYMSGYTDDAIVSHGVLAEGTHFLAKPFTSTALTEKVREVLDIGVTQLADGHAQVVKDEDEKEQKQPLDRDALSGLSPDVLAKLRNAVIAARYGEIVKIIETIRVIEPNLATELRRMADLFDYDGMREFLSQ